MQCFTSLSSYMSFAEDDAHSYNSSYWVYVLRLNYIILKIAALL